MIIVGTYKILPVVGECLPAEQPWNYDDSATEGACFAIHKLSGHITMKSAVVTGLLIASMSLGLTACNQAKSPDQVQADVAKASADAADKSAKADATQKQAEAQASDQLAKDKAAAETKATDTSVAAVADAAVTDAEGETKIALAKCQALDGNAQRQCKDDANAHLKAVKDRADAARKGPVTP